jgi:peptidoglycan/LPS O-acetylase OafA/YrhL
MSEAVQPKLATRLHDLDALRAFAMLLGIVLHAALSFTGYPWIVQDSHSSFVFGLMVAAIHGFRMQLFMLISGYFTMMIYRNRGLGSLLKQRFKRVVVPFLVGLITVIPALEYATKLAIVKASQNPGPSYDVNESAVFTAIREGQPEALKKALESGGDPNKLDKKFGIPMLGWAALLGDVDLTRILLDAGANVNVRSTGGHRPIHQATFLGHPTVLNLLIERGADLTVRSDKGESAADTAKADHQLTEYFAGLFGVKVKAEVELRAGRDECLKILESHVGPATVEVPLTKPNILTRARMAYSGWIDSDRFQTDWTHNGSKIQLFKTPIFHHLWFLWFLYWLVAGFAIFMLLFGKLTALSNLWKLFEGPAGFALLIALTMIPQVFMGAESLGPDTSTGLLPMPHMLLYYGIFFAYGAILFDGGSTVFARFEKGWWLRIGLCLAAPAALITFGKPVASGLAQSIYSWAMIFGCLGLFRKRLHAENHVIRYLSDSSYWLYLVHLPLIVVGQSWISRWNLPSGVKFPGLILVSMAILLLSYQILVRHTFIGRFLNGPRKPRLLPVMTE